MQAAKQKRSTLNIDGSTGEGGGQIIRTALSLSMLTGTPIRMTNIRSGRAKSGLMRQHLMCMQASQRISNAHVTGDFLGSTTFTFTPNEIQQGNYSFDIGSAGSTSLVLQTILPALLFARSTSTYATTDSNDNEFKPSTVTVKGGTHNPLAPTTDFLNLAFVPAIAKLGMRINIELIQAGYAPVGGGEVKATIYPYLRRASMPTLNLKSRYELVGIELVASHLNLASDICKRELSSAQKVLVKTGISESLITTKYNKQQGIGEGNSCYAVVTHSLIDGSGLDKASFARQGGKDNNDKQYEKSYIAVHNEVFSVLGEKRMSAEKVGNRLAGLVKRYLNKTDALVDEYLTDQLLLPLALSGGGEFTARMISGHSETQARMIEQFLPVSITFEDLAESKVLVKVC